MSRPSRSSSPAVRTVLTVVIAVAIGPLIAGLAVFLLALASSALDRALWPETFAEFVHDFVQLFIVYVAFSYLAGSGIALLAGILAAVWMIWRPLNLIVVVAAAIVATLVCLFIPSDWSFSVRDDNLLVTLVLAVIAAAGCWLLFRRYARAA
jgi:hypothetical protein